jgi:hypothetical protein
MTASKQTARRIIVQFIKRGDEFLKHFHDAQVEVEDLDEAVDQAAERTGPRPPDYIVLFALYELRDDLLRWFEQDGGHHG